jgi:hypothetical protein
MLFPFYKIKVPQQMLNSNFFSFLRPDFTWHMIESLGSWCSILQRRNHSMQISNILCITYIMDFFHCDVSFSWETKVFGLSINNDKNL